MDRARASTLATGSRPRGVARRCCRRSRSKGEDPLSPSSTNHIARTPRGPTVDLRERGRVILPETSRAARRESDYRTTASDTVPRGAYDPMLDDATRARSQLPGDVDRWGCSRTRTSERHRMFVHLPGGRRMGSRRVPAATTPHTSAHAYRLCARVRTQSVAGTRT